MSNSGPLSQPEKQPKADKPAEVDEDDDMSLPPLDADEEAETSAEEEDLDDLVPGEETDSLDDADATDLDVGAELDQDDDDDENGADATEGGIDVGALDDEIDATDEEESAVDRDEERSASIDDDGVDDLDNDTTRDDGGAEGTGENAEDDVDESALPDLDESEHDEADDTLADILLEEAESLPPWAATRFVLLDPLPEPAPSFDAPTAQEQQGARVAVVTDGSLKLSRDGGQSFEAIDLQHVVAACFASAEEAAPLYVLIASKASGSVFLGRVTEDGEPSRLAEIAPLKGATDFSEAQIRCDQERKIVWVRSKQGCFALAPAR